MLIYIVMGFNVLVVFIGLFVGLKAGLIGEFGTLWLIYMALAAIADSKNATSKERVPLAQLTLCPYNFMTLVVGSMFGVWTVGRAYNAPTFWLVALFSMPMLLPCFMRIFTMGLELIRLKIQTVLPATECQES